MGFEPKAHSLEGCCSIQLSYGTKTGCKINKKISSGKILFMKLSIVIPVYNVEDTLERCVRSILNQRFRDYQLILVDDGSTDQSPAICDMLTQEDHRIQVVHKKNGGLSSARNKGISKARGEYITFVDSDDRIGEDTLAPLMQILSIHHEYDILEYPVYIHYGNTRRQQKFYPETRVYTDMYEYWIMGKAYQHSYAWNKIYRRTLFDNICFPEGKIFEDVYTLPQLLKKCETVATTNEGLYYYYDNPKGITATADGKALLDLLNAHLPMLQETASYSKYHNLWETYYAHVLNIQMDVFEQNGGPLLLPLMPARATWKLKLLHIIGLKRLCQINSYIHKIYRRSR